MIDADAVRARTGRRRAGGAAPCGDARRRRRGRAELAAAVTSEIGQLFGAAARLHDALDGDTIRAIGDWCFDPGAAARRRARLLLRRRHRHRARRREPEPPSGSTRRPTSAPSSRGSAWAEFGFQAALGAPIVVAGEIWGGVVAFRTHPDDPFPPGLEHRLGQLRGARGAGDLQRRGAARGGRARRRAVRAARDRDAGGGRTPAGGGARRGDVHGRPAVRRDTRARRAARGRQRRRRGRRGRVGRRERRGARTGLVVRAGSGAARRSPCSRPGSRAASTS